ncbi:MAG: Asp-tRNA(Asn)/Glu-tRNA(Gln) amidotransferase subunit GatC [Patescibacteria group bacterium]
MKFTKDEVQKIAKLSRLMLSEDEEKAMGKDLSEILDYFDILKKVNTGKVEPINQITGLLNVKRKDEVNFNYDRDEMLESAPDKKDNLIKVKKIFE